MTPRRPLAALPVVAAILLFAPGCTDESLGLLSQVELINRTGFTVEVYVGETLKVSRLPNGGTAEFETSAGRRPIRVTDLGSGLNVVEEQYRFDAEALNIIELSDARSRLEIRHTSDCCLRVRADDRQVAEIGGVSTREVLLPAGSREIELRTCTGVVLRSESRVFLPGATTVVDTLASDCP